MSTPNRAAGTSVPAQAVINQLHERYGQTISRLMQENAELSAALDSIAAERDEYKARIMAASSAGAETTEDPLAARYVPQGFRPAEDEDFSQARTNQI
jgi:hypothetical protein